MINLDKEELVQRIGNANEEEQRIIAAQIPSGILFKELEVRSAYMENQLTEINSTLNRSEAIQNGEQNFYRRRFNKVY